MGEKKITHLRDALPSVGSIDCMCCAKDHRDSKRRHETMYQPNPTEVFRERQLALVREAEDRRLARQLRKARLKGHRSLRGRLEESWLQILWSTGRVP
jgi:hypothetical protein